MAISKFEIPWTVFPEMGRHKQALQSFDSQMRSFRENAAHIKALKEYFHAMQKCFKQSNTFRERLDILAVCKEINDTARRVKQESDALRKSSQDALARQKH
jgi:hypothetical protein